MEQSSSGSDIAGSTASATELASLVLYEDVLTDAPEKRSTVERIREVAKQIEVLAESRHTSAD